MFHFEYRDRELRNVNVNHLFSSRYHLVMQRVWGWTELFIKKYIFLRRSRMCHVKVRKQQQTCSIVICFSRGFSCTRRTQSYNYEKHTHIMATDSTEKKQSRHGSRWSSWKSTRVIFSRLIVIFRCRFLTFSRLKFFLIKLAILQTQR